MPNSTVSNPSAGGGSSISVSSGGSSSNSAARLSSLAVTADLDLVQLAPYVPLRLTAHERALFTVLEQCLHVSEYTDEVDVSSSAASALYHHRSSLSSARNSATATTKTRRILSGIWEACHIATGLAIASGQEKKQLSEICGNHEDEDDGTSASNLKTSVASRLALRNLLAKKKNKKKNAKDKKNGKKNKKLSSKRRVAENQSQDDDQITSWASRSPSENEAFFQTLFEIGRRHKILNPSSMRTTYGKLMYLLQDAQNPTVAKSLGFSLHKELNLVGSFLEKHNCEDLLHDPRLECAVQYISDRDVQTGQRLPRDVVQAMIQGKQRVTNQLIAHYSKPTETETTTPPTTTTESSLMDEEDKVPEQQPEGMETVESDDGVDMEEKKEPMASSTSSKSRSSAQERTMSADDVRRVIDSLADAVAYIESNLRPVQSMLHHLEDNFHPQRINNKLYSLSLRGGGRSSSSNALATDDSATSTRSSSYSRFGHSAYTSGSEGPTLSHSHNEQFIFVWQSLRLWCKVMRHMHRLWVCADDDLLSTTCMYHLYNTGQGLNRVQACPRVRKVMTSLLYQTQQEAKTPWVGLSVIHLGDRDVPNALVFIDKYTQIPRFLNPIVNFLQVFPELCEQDERIRNYVDHQFGSQNALKMMVLTDYFKHGFDGSGDDGGSCIDGRLTSSWNWTSRIAKKKYYYAFMLSGFQGWDGDFR